MSKKFDIHRKLFFWPKQKAISSFRNDSISLAQYMNGLTDKISLSQIVNIMAESMSPKAKASVQMLFVIKSGSNSQDLKPLEISLNFD